MILKGKTAVVTGAGRGIGREIALLLAQEGAKVVVNDCDRENDPERGETRIADGVVRDIQNQGGEGAANYEAVGTMESGKKIIQAAIDHFGKIDILVNNAGILRDRMIFNMSEEEWDAVLAVHLKGTFACTRAAVPLMREQRSGRIINFTSTSGLIGNLGQANYAAAKMGIVGFTKVVALDMARYHVTANCVSPFAWTRMIGTIPTDTEEQKKRVEKMKKMSPAHVAPLVAYLAGDGAQEISGQIFGVRGKEIFLFSQPRPIRSIHHSEGWTAERLAEVLKGTLGPSLVPLQTSPQVFNYDPLV
jgi:NAD(P)-dependent dehydrogenase (short-subunit alcohol dehydrogenase family)